MTKDELHQSSSDDEFGPVPAPERKKTKINYTNDQIFLNNLPNADFYEQSFMHGDTISHIAISNQTQYIATASVDGHLRFWYYNQDGVEFVKHIKAHTSSIIAMHESVDGIHLGTISADNTYKHFDFTTFDMISIIKLTIEPIDFAFITCENDLHHKIAICYKDFDEIHVFSPNEGTNIVSKYKINVRNIQFLIYNIILDICVSIDSNGGIDLWDRTFKFPSSDVFKFKLKSETDLYDLKKNNTIANAVAISPNGAFMAISTTDGLIRLYSTSTMKLRKIYDETVQMYIGAQNDPNHKVIQIDSLEFGRKLDIEKEIGKARLNTRVFTNILFDESSSFLIFPSIIGIKIINIHTNQLARIVGKAEKGLRFLYISCFQKKNFKNFGVKNVGGDVSIRNKDFLLPLFACTSFNKNRFYIFSRRNPKESDMEIRDVVNLKPTRDDISATIQSVKSGHELAKTATIHTSMGDIYIKLFYDECPKTVENFTVHSINGYYNNCIFHRVINNFMIQTGDPGGDGTGGESIWGGEFEDEIVQSLKHDRPFTVSMANAGENTNGSQFFITTVPCPWLDGKHTVFGRVTKGMDVVQKIEKTPTNHEDRPLSDIRIMSIKVQL
ncbi:peptidylprolyl isomerase domain and WD repeat-containing protein 1 [Babesia microti strain RI]|uniref:peptidylprolyl isomerase n=1 Tax=Babesia microti (strain RI) TaxID=1133968 RepID=A0A1R4ACA7_BABMR|nr:peptidylprolyl isomerase domain and WD repeat-containing protein 1 [Babesia microti strain RI]SJK86618.1 peptidylprolyl isomerase domain and WD repeat-containing protein 1 [Babesia microti strain RI]|eukprot:XP_021338755.1 peptidylprolyl isomerase domain and WD repeat-containing protein 1 [Babesia microti strain RI]